MIRKNLSLDVIDIHSPCSASWDAMRGDDRSRFCGECKLHVYNLSDMTREAAEALVNEREGRLCVRFYRRADGTVLTRDCSRVRAAMRRTKQLATAMLGAAMCAMLAPFGLAQSQQATMGRIAQPPTTWPAALQGEISATMGGMSAPPSTQPTTQPCTQPSTQPSGGTTMGALPAPRDR